MPFYGVFGSQDPALAAVEVAMLPQICPEPDCRTWHDGPWPLGLHGGRLVVICPTCHVAVAQVVAVRPD